MPLLLFTVTACRHEHVSLALTDGAASVASMLPHQVFQFYALLVHTTHIGQSLSYIRVAVMPDSHRHQLFFAEVTYYAVYQRQRLNFGSRTFPAKIHF